MSSMNEKYNNVLYKLANIKHNNLKASDFNLNYYDFKNIIDELEKDELIIRNNSWCIDDSYIFTGLTFKGKSFVENHDAKEYSKIEKTEINNNLSIGTNHGIAVAGNDNIINNSEFNQKFTQLIQEIQNSNIGDRSQIIQDLNDKKEDKEALQTLLGTLVTRGAEVATLISTIGALLGIL